MRSLPKQQEMKFRTWGGKREGAGRKRHTGELPHLKRADLRSREPQHVTIGMRRSVVSLRRSKSFGAVKQVFKRCREGHGMRLCQFAVLGDHVHFIVEAENRAALGRAMQALSVRLAAELNHLMARKGGVIRDRYHVRALKTPTEVLRALNYLKNNAQKHGFTRGPDSYASWANQEVIAEPRTWL